MKPRIEQLYRVLKPTGSFYYHCDWHASHYIKVMLDREDLFGYKNFRNEIVWHYIMGGFSKNYFGRKHDTILFYVKDPRKQTFYADAVRIPYNPETIARMHRGMARYNKKDISELSKRGKIPDDVWEINPLQGNAKERLGYPTQKPKALLERIITASSKEGDVVLDAFCGCGTTVVVAQKLKRSWIGIDISPTSCRVTAKELQDKCGLREGQDFWVRDLPKTVEELRQYPAFEFQNWAVNALGGVPSKIKVKDKGIDGKLYPVEDIKKEKKDTTVPL